MGVIKKLTPNDLFVLIEDEQPEPDSKLLRVKGRCISHEKEGWVTLKGNAGTVYAEQSTKHYKVLRETSLTKTMKSAGADEIRKLEVDEALEVLEGPKDETFAPEVRVKCKAMTD